jgi:hypothetical protein
MSERKSLCVGEMTAPCAARQPILRPLTGWPAALRLDQAAAYCGLSVDTFKDVCPVRPIQFTQSTRGHRYLRASLDNWLVSLDQNGTSSAPTRRRIGERIGGQS